MQEALTSLHRHWRRFGAHDNREAYARRAVINAALSWRRRRRVTEVPLDVAGDPAACGEVSRELDSDLVRALRALPPRMRAAVVLRYVEDRSEAETAELLSCSVGTVKSSCHRGLVRVRQHLADTSIAALQHVGGTDDDQP